jgi:hypothetical protein
MQLGRQDQYRKRLGLLQIHLLVHNHPIHLHLLDRGLHYREHYRHRRQNHHRLRLHRRQHPHLSYHQCHHCLGRNPRNHQLRHCHHRYRRHLHCFLFHRRPRRNLRNCRLHHHQCQNL